MSMSTNIVAFRPPDEKWKKMKNVYDSCVNAGIEIPDEVEGYFNGEPPDAAGVEIDISDLLEEWENDYSRGYQLCIENLPKDVKYLRFYNSW